MMQQKAHQLFKLHCSLNIEQFDLQLDVQLPMITLRPIEHEDGPYTKRAVWYTPTL